MHSSFYVALALVAAIYVNAIELPEVKDQPGKPIDPKQVKNATITFYNNGTYIYMLEVPCDAYLGGSGSGASARSGSQRSGQLQQQQHSSSGEDHHEEGENDDDNDDEHTSSQQQMSPQQRQRQRQQQQSGQLRSRSTSAASQQHHEHLSPEELQKAHSGTKCECQCRNKEGEELDDIITVSFGGQKKGSSSSGQQSGGSRQSQQQRLQQRTQERQRQQQQRGSGQQAGRQQQKSSNGEEEGPELVYPEQPRPGQKCIFYEDGEWENDDDELIAAIKPAQKEQSESEDTKLETCTFNFKKPQAQKSTVTLQCVDNDGEQDQYNVKIVDGDLKPLLTPQQKQELQQQKNQQKGQQGSQQRNRQQQQQQE